MSFEVKVFKHQWIISYIFSDSELLGMLATEAVESIVAAQRTNRNFKRDGCLSSPVLNYNLRLTHHSDGRLELRDDDSNSRLTYQ